MTIDEAAAYFKIPNQLSSASSKEHDSCLKGLEEMAILQLYRLKSLKSETLKNDRKRSTNDAA